MVSACSSAAASSEDGFFRRTIPSVPGTFHTLGPVGRGRTLRPQVFAGGSGPAALAHDGVQADAFGVTAYVVHDDGLARAVARGVVVV